MTYSPRTAAFSDGREGDRTEHQGKDRRFVQNRGAEESGAPCRRPLSTLRLSRAHENEHFLELGTDDLQPPVHAYEIPQKKDRNDRGYDGEESDVRRREGSRVKPHFPAPERAGRSGEAQSEPPSRGFAYLPGLSKLNGVNRELREGTLRFLISSIAGLPRRDVYRRNVEVAWYV